LRTRLSRVERTVGVFVVLATLLLVVGFAYYVYHTVQRKGWFVPKVNYFTMLFDASGLKVGDPVMLMGFPAGEITRITPNDPSDYYSVTVEFQVKKPFYGYIWDDSTIKVQASLLGSRYLEMTKGSTTKSPPPKPTYIEAPSPQDKPDGVLRIWLEPDKKLKFAGAYVPVATYSNRNIGYWLPGFEAPPLSDQVSKLIEQVGIALPNILSLTNQVTGSLSNSASLMVVLNETVQQVRPVVSNLYVISAHLSNPKGSLGEWLIPTQINDQVRGTLSTTSNTIYTAETNLTLVTSNLNRTLDNLAGITANLRQQVQANSLMLSEISGLVVSADDFLQGLKRNWLLKGAFNAATNPLPQSILKPGVGGPR